MNQVPPFYSPVVHWTIREWSNDSRVRRRLDRYKNEYTKDYHSKNGQEAFCGRTEKWCRHWLNYL